MKNCIIFLILLITCFPLSGQNHRIYGIIKDEISGEVLIGANIYDSISQKGTVSSKDGFYLLELADTESVVIYSYVGYKNFIYSFNLANDTLANIYLSPGKSLSEVIITAPVQNISVFRISSKQLMSIPVLGGEPDLMKYIQLLPGIQPGSEGTGSINVRGGGPGENLVLLDRVPLYYVNHLGGFVSLFNPYIINDANIYTGNFPAEFGGRLSSALDITMKDGNSQKIKGSASIGLISSKIAFDGPLINKKLSIVFSARRTYLDLFLLPFYKLVSPNISMSYNFYDVNAKLNYQVNEKNSFQIFSYYGDDRLGFKYKDDKDLFKLKNTWGNAFISFQYKSILSNGIQITNQAIFSRYRLKTTNHLEFNEPENYSYNHFFYSGIRDAGFRSDWLLNLASYWEMKTGIHLFYHRYAPAADGEIINNRIDFFRIRNQEFNYYLDNYFHISNNILLRTGMRLNAYIMSGKKWLLAEPRLNLVYHISRSVSILGSYSRMNQFVHQLRSSGNTMNPEIWVPVMKNISPSSSDIISVGTSFDFNNTMYKVQVETYYRQMENLVDYKEGELYIRSSTNWYNKLESGGSGNSYGLEIFFEKKSGILIGNLSYTYSRSFRQFKSVNEGKIFPYNYDRPHNISLNISYPVSEHLEFDVLWVLMSGLPITLPIGKQEIINHPDDELLPDDDVYVYSEKNAYRMKLYHRMDIAIHFTPRNRKRNSSWSLSIYNIYNRQNPYYYKFNYDSLGKIVTRQVSFFPIIPSISYNVEF